MKQVRRQITSVKTLADRVKERREELGLSQAELAQRCGVKQGTIGNIETGIRKQPRELLALAKALGFRPEYLVSGALPREAIGVPITPQKRGVAHDLSQSQSTVDPANLAWEQLMTADLTKPFSLVVLDDAMAPMLESGTLARFDPTRPPRAGRPVLIADGRGNHFIRTYQPKRPGHWMAVAENAGYLPLDSIADGLRIVATMTGFDWV